MMLQTISRPGHSYSLERGALLHAARLAELEQTTAQLQRENIELNRRLNMQNRPHKRLQSAIETATIILAEHVAGRQTGRRYIKDAYPSIGRRRWEMGVALLRLAGIVTGYNQFGLIFNDRLSVNRAWEKLKSVGASVESLSQLVPYLPKHRK